MKISYNWLKWYVPEIVEADKLADVFTYHLTEVEGIEKKAEENNSDTIFDLNILPNRAHDLLSHHGVARELAGQLGIKFNDPSPMYKIPVSKPTNLKIEAKNARRYMGRIVRNVKVGPSPEWVKNHLESIGQRSINNIVDATNITMYDCGQPCHAFDLDKLASENLIVRYAQEGEMIMTLDGKEIKLKDTDLVIADEKNVLAIAGVKGGKIAEVDENTKNILLEVANFDPTSVRKTSRRLGILTDSSKRFENNFSPELCSFAMLELSALLVEYGFTDFEEIVDINNSKQIEKKISFSAELVNKKLGINIPVEEIEKILKNYNYTYTKTGESFEIIIPPLRLDLVIPEDMVEEIGRIYGYDKVIPEIPHMSDIWKPQVNKVFSQMSWARNKLLNDGYNEVMTYSFCNKGQVEVLASASDKKFLRTNLTDGLKESLVLNKVNSALLGLKEVKIFEIGTVFSKNGEQINVAYGDKKNITEVSLDEFCNQFVMENSGAFALGDIGQGTHDALNSPSRTFKMWSLYPFITRDIAIWADENTISEVPANIIKENMGELVVRGPELFDTFKKPARPEGGDGKISYAFRLIFQSFEKTLTDEEINVYMQKINEKLVSAGFELR
ncbi:phenylalanine--tRNA ligase subunit beta [Candidatus Nomurabacteria bacterium]|nr:phenylalanine--tRNA ligase subunit beta [Candidatus Nomurabacteria bacterium]